MALTLGDKAYSSPCLVVACDYNLFLLNCQGQSLQCWVLMLEHGRVEAVYQRHPESARPDRDDGEVVITDLTGTNGGLQNTYRSPATEKGQEVSTRPELNKSRHSRAMTTLGRELEARDKAVLRRIRRCAYEVDDDGVERALEPLPSRDVHPLAGSSRSASEAASSGGR